MEKFTDEILDQIRGLPIDKIISKRISIATNGSINLKALCPFHSEKTPSLIIFPKKNNFKCFGCGEGGDGIGFVMNFEKIGFSEACKKIALDNNIDISKIVIPKENPKKRKQKELHALAAKFFQNALNSDKCKLAREYALNRWKEETIKEWGIGLALEDWQGLLNHFNKREVDSGDIVDAGLASEKNGKTFDFFRNRIMIPISNQHGEIVGFTGRNFNQPDEKQKYLNTRETDIYSKGNILFGLDKAFREIHQKKQAILVEGAPDVLRLHEIGIFNVVSPLGTSLTEYQVKILKNLMCDILIIPDKDEAGNNSLQRNAEKLIAAGIFVNVLFLDGEEGADPDSFFKDYNVERFNKYIENQKKDYIFYLSEGAIKQNPIEKQKIIKKTASLLSSYPQEAQSMYIDALGTVLKPKSALIKAMSEFGYNERKVGKEGSDIIPKSVDLNHFTKYGFYEEKNQLFFRTNNGIIRGANFTLTPLFHVESTNPNEARRLFRIVNEYNVERIIELSQRDLANVQSFRLKVESLGNFLWEVGEAHLLKFKRYIYLLTQTCIEIKQLGWQKKGFWAWSNGIFSGKEFIPVNSFGIVQLNDKNYYLPAFSKVNDSDPGLFHTEKEYVHREAKTNFPELIEKTHRVFGENSHFAFCFLIATIFKDYIASRLGFFPILNIFGPKGTGKTELAWIILQFFGKQSKGININSASKPSLADHLALGSNTISHIDEYKNNLEFEKIEFLKGVWDLMGRTRMNMDKDKKKETSAVDSGLILTGQEMPTTDPALFSRLIFLTFFKSEFTDQQKKEFNDLKEIGSKGFTHLTHELLKLRTFFEENFMDNYNIISENFNSLLSDRSIEDRIFKNWIIIIAAYSTISEKLNYPIELEGLSKKAVELIQRQNDAIKKDNGVANFWSTIKYLIREGEINNNVDFRIEFKDKEELEKTNLNFEGVLRNLFYLDHTRAFEKYLKHGNITKEETLKKSTLKYYLENSPEYYGNKRKMRFAKDPLGEKSFVTNAMVFDFLKLHEAYGLTDFTENEEE